MKKLKTIYRILTRLMAAFMLLGALIDVSGNQDSVALIRHLAFDTFSALFSHFSTGESPDKWIRALLGLVLTLASYMLFSGLSKRDVEGKPGLNNYTV